MTKGILIALKILPHMLLYIAFIKWIFDRFHTSAAASLRESIYVMCLRWLWCWLIPFKAQIPHKNNNLPTTLAPDLMCKTSQCLGLHLSSALSILYMPLLQVCLERISGLVDSILFFVDTSRRKWEGIIGMAFVCPSVHPSLTLTIPLHISWSL